jgi:hypothetical protein
VRPPHRNERVLFYNIFQELATAPEHWAKGVAVDTDTPPAVLNALGRHFSSTVRRLVAGNANTPEDATVVLANQRPELPAAQDVIAGEPVSDVSTWDTPSRYSCAVDPNAAPAVLSSLMYDDDDDVCQGVAGNLNVPIIAQRILAEHPNKDVRFRLAGNPNAESSVLIKLATDPDGIVRRKVAENPNAPFSAVSVLRNDSDPVVQATATRAYRYAPLPPGTGRPEEWTPSLIVAISNSVEAVTRRVIEGHPGLLSEMCALLDNAPVPNPDEPEICFLDA